MAATILVCDDHETLRDLVRGALAGNGYTIVEARDGDESLELARKLRPDLVVLDLVMPGRSGHEVLFELRRDPLLSETPVIVCTATRKTMNDRLAIELGADRYLEKPFSPGRLAETVTELLGRRT